VLAHHPYAVEDRRVPATRLDDMVSRILHALIRVGVPDDPPGPSSGEIGGEMAVARTIADSSRVLLKNDDDLLPLSPSLRRVAVIGSHADVAVPSGGGAAAGRSPRRRSGVRSGTQAASPYVGIDSQLTGGGAATGRA
jgi:beta-glucosidase